MNIGDTLKVKVQRVGFTAAGASNSSVETNSHESAGFSSAAKNIDTEEPEQYASKNKQVSMIDTVKKLEEQSDLQY